MLSQAEHDAAANRMRAAVPGLAALLAISACAPRPVERPAEDRPPGVVQPADARTYRVDAEGTELLLLVFRAGPLARLGHNHAITSQDESGTAWISRDGLSAGFDLRLPVERMLVDDPAARARAGTEFAAAVPDDAREGTRRNMLRAEVLDAASYPEIRLQAQGLAAIAGSQTVPVVVTLKDSARTLQVPVELSLTATAVAARGTLRVRQSDFGIVPFSVGGGAIQVADEIEVRFEFLARAD